MSKKNKIILDIKKQRKISDLQSKLRQLENQKQNLKTRKLWNLSVVQK